MNELQCTRCGNKTLELKEIDAGLAERIRDSGNTDPLPPQVCQNCFNQLTDLVAAGSSVLRAQERAKEQRKLNLWNSRVGLLRKARQFMNEKNFAMAAVQYEKYLKVLELLFEAAPGHLTPEHFRASARTQELTVVSGAYWDLLRIFDTNEKYHDRMHLAGKKLAQFLKYTPIYPDIMRKAESFALTAKNPAVIKAFIKSASETKGRCFIATAAFQSTAAAEVLLLQDWRDDVLIQTNYGRAFVKFYYLISPLIAALLDHLPILKAPVRGALRAFINLINRAVRH